MEFSKNKIFKPSKPLHRLGHKSFRTVTIIDDLQWEVVINCFSIKVRVQRQAVRLGFLDAAPGSSFSLTFIVISFLIMSVYPLMASRQDSFGQPDWSRGQNNFILSPNRQTLDSNSRTSLLQFTSLCCRKEKKEWKLISSIAPNPQFDEKNLN